MNTLFYIVEKGEFINGQLIYSNIGYTLNQEDADAINATYHSTFKHWINSNIVDLQNGTKLVAEYFIDNPPFYNAETTTTCIDEMNLSLIDINTL
jgi:hypothetical protein